MSRILIVEDERKIARFLELELQHEGYGTAKAADGRTGLEMSESGDYDLVILDIMLPALSGIDFASTSRNKPHFARKKKTMIGKHNGQFT